VDETGAQETSESEDEQIFVTREEEQLDPEAEADFDQAFERMMAESLDSRKFERKSVFDVPLPIRRAQRDVTTAAEETAERDTQTAPDTMAFALMTKKGNRQQVRCTLKPISNSFI
jgi:regulator of nonsense transcripts 2